MLEWDEDQLRNAGLNPKKVKSIVRRFRKLSEEMAQMDLKVYGASGTGWLIHHSRPTHDENGYRNDDAEIALLGYGFDGGDW